jgi:hypothetical protein
LYRHHQTHPSGALARRKKVIIPMAMLQAFFDAPLWVVRVGGNDYSTTNNTTTTTTTTPTPPLASFARYDEILVVAAMGLNANGFALG